MTDRACKWSATYESVIGSGMAEIVNDLEDKKVALEFIMHQYGRSARDFAEDVMKKTLIFRVRILEISGKTLK